MINDLSCELLVGVFHTHDYGFICSCV